MHTQVVMVISQRDIFKMYIRSCHSFASNPSMPSHNFIIKFLIPCKSLLDPMDLYLPLHSPCALCLSGPRYARLFLHSRHCSLHLAHVPPSSWMAGSPSFYGWAQLPPPSRCWPTLWKLPHAPSFSAILLHHGTYSHQSTLFTCSLHTGSLLCAISCYSSGTQKRLVSRLNK